MATSKSVIGPLSNSSRFTSTRRPQIHCLYRWREVANALPTIDQQQTRGYAAANKGKQSAKPKSNAEKRAEATALKRKKARAQYRYPDLKQAEQFSLIDAMRYIRAFEVGQNPSSPKYELHLRLRTLKNGPVIRNRFRLPHPVKTDLRIAVICPPGSKTAQQAKQAGAVMVGEDEIFDAVKEGKVEFERCLCHTDSLPKLAKSGIARILGPRGLMPSTKLGTVTKDVAASVRDMVGGSEYRERMGVIRMAVGQLAFTPEEVQKNIRAVVDQVKKDVAVLSDKISKEIHEVVLSSTHAPGFSLNGEFRGAESVASEALSTRS